MTRGLGASEITNHAETLLVRPRVSLLRAGTRAIATAVLLPEGSDRLDAASLPVLLDPYGGTQAQLVLSARSTYPTSQWFADQGCGRRRRARHTGPGERWSGPSTSTSPLRCSRTRSTPLQLRPPSIRNSTCPAAIRGWSFGGYLAALAILRRPDVFHAAIAGAPVADWRLYDTHYTERYLGTPQDEPDAYDRTSLVAEVARAQAEERPVRPLLIHGLADDNVVAAHTLQLSSAPRRWSPAPRAPVVGRHPHDAAGGRGREPAAAPTAFLRESLGLT